MGRFKASEVENYGGQGGGGFFTIKEDKGVKQVRFMYNSFEDVQGYAVHEVELDGKRRYVSCLRNYNDPIDKCPFCAAHKPQFAKAFIPVYDVEEGKVKWWERGKSFFSKISSICARYAEKDNLVQSIFEIERNGKPGDMKTSYEIYFVEKDDTQLEDLDPVSEVIGTLVLDKSADEMKYYLEKGDFPQEDEQPVRRRTEEEPRRRTTREEPVRRTPTRRTSNDRF